MFQYPFADRPVGEMPQGVNGIERPFHGSPVKGLARGPGNRIQFERLQVHGCVDHVLDLIVPQDGGGIRKDPVQLPVVLRRQLNMVKLGQAVPLVGAVGMKVPQQVPLDADADRFAQTVRADIGLQVSGIGHRVALGAVAEVYLHIQGIVGMEPKGMDGPALLPASALGKGKLGSQQQKDKPVQRFHNDINCST